MNTSIQNNLNYLIQQELEKSINKLYKNKLVQFNLNYPPVIHPLKIIQIGGEYCIVNDVGEIITNIKSNLYTLGKKTYDIFGTGYTNLRDIILETPESSKKIADQLIDGAEAITNKVVNTVVGLFGVSVENKTINTEQLKQIGGVSILNISDNSTRMLIPNNFLTSKHVYFVKYDTNGTNLYDYKMVFKGGSVSNLYLKNNESIWNNNKPVQFISNNSIIGGMNILNDLVNDLVKSPHIREYVQKCISDKNYKLK
jgi:hypothetical protein